MAKIAIDPWADFTKNDLIRVIKQMETRLAGMAERTRALELEVKRRNELIENTIAREIMRLGEPSRHAQDAEKMVQWLLDLESDFRPLIGVENVRYGIQDYCYRKDADPQLLKLARIFRDIINYFGWDDK